MEYRDQIRALILLLLTQKKKESSEDILTQLGFIATDVSFSLLNPFLT